MTIMITGATGLIGSRLAWILANRGRHVHALCRSEKKAEALLNPFIKVFYGDIDDLRVVTEALEGCEQLYHLAAYTGVWHRNKDHYLKINVEATRDLLDCAAKAGVRKVVVASTAGVFGPSSGEPLNEESPKPEFYFTYYEESKARMEEMISEFHPDGMEVVIVNPTRLYGPAPLHKSNSVTKLMVNYIKGRWRFLPGSGRSTGNYAFLHDVVEGMVLAMQMGKDHQRYILGGENMDYRDLFKRIGAVAGTRHPLVPLPLPLMIVTAWIMKMGAEITGRSPLITPDWVRKYHHDWKLSSGKAGKELGYRITSFEEGVEQIMQYYQLCRK